MCLVDWDLKLNWIFCIDFQQYCEFSTRCHCNVILGYRSSKIERIKIWPFRVATYFTVYRSCWGLWFCLCMSSKSYRRAHRLICFSLKWCPYVKIRVFRGFLLVAKSAFYLHHVRPSAWSVGISPAITGRILLKFYIKDFYENMSIKSKFV